MLWEYLEQLYLGHKAPAADTATVLYTCPAGTTVIVDSLFANNLDYQSNVDDMISIRIIDWGTTPADQYALLNNYQLKNNENLVKWKIVLNPSDSIVVKSIKWHTSFLAFWAKDPWNAVIDWLKNKVVAGTDTAADREDLMLLTWWAYQNVTVTP